MKYLFKTEKPYGDILLLSCDSFFFNEHSIPLIYSGSEQGYNIHLNIINPDIKDTSLLHKLKSVIKTNLTFSSEIVDLDKTIIKNYFACSRFFISSVLIDNCKSILIVDADSIIKKKYKIRNNINLGLYIRNPCPDINNFNSYSIAMLAGLVYITKNSKDFLLGACKRMKKYKFNNWFCDQISLFEEFYESNWINNQYFLNFKNIEYLFDWEFNDNSYIWTAKGERKNIDEKYLGLKNKIMNCINYE